MCVCFFSFCYCYSSSTSVASLCLAVCVCVCVCYYCILLISFYISLRLRPLFCDFFFFNSSILPFLLQPCAAFSHPPLFRLLLLLPLRFVIAARSRNGRACSLPRKKCRHLGGQIVQVWKQTFFSTPTLSSHPPPTVASVLFSLPKEGGGEVSLNMYVCLCVGRAWSKST